MSKTKSPQVAQGYDELPTRMLTRTPPCSIIRCGAGGEPALADVAEARRTLPMEREAAFAHERVQVTLGGQRTVPDAS